MIGLERHIEILLLDNDCVMVPGFGGFVAYHVDARYYEDESTFLPPLRTIGFNPQLGMNDSLLVQSYIEAYDMSYPEALKRIEGEVNELKSNLDNTGAYELNGVGVVSRNDEGHYIFEPCEAGLLTPDLYGLSSVEIPRRANDPIESVEIATETAANDDSDGQSATIIPMENAEIEDEDAGALAKTVSIRVSVLRDLAVACLVVIAFMLFPSTLNDVPNSHLLKGDLYSGMLYSIMPKDLQTNVANLNITKINKAVVREDTVKVGAKPAVAAPKMYYTIVLASRVTKKNAAAYVGQLNKEGYSEAFVLSRKVGAKVIYGKYVSENQAYNALNRLRAGSGFSDAWVMRIS